MSSVREFQKRSLALRVLREAFPTATEHDEMKVWRLQNDISSIPLGKEPPKLTQEVFMLINALRQEDYSFNINGYFNVNLPTYTSIAGAALMYTVFLVQASTLPVDDGGQR